MFVVAPPARDQVDQDRSSLPTSSDETLAEALAMRSLKMTAVELGFLMSSMQGRFDKSTEQLVSA